MTQEHKNHWVKPSSLAQIQYGNKQKTCLLRVLANLNCSYHKLNGLSVKLLFFKSHLAALSLDTLQFALIPLNLLFGNLCSALLELTISAQGSNNSNWANYSSLGIALDLLTSSKRFRYRRDLVSVRVQQISHLKSVFEIIKQDILVMRWENHHDNEPPYLHMSDLKAQYVWSVFISKLHTPSVYAYLNITVKYIFPKCLSRLGMKWLK